MNELINTNLPFDFLQNCANRCYMIIQVVDQAITIPYNLGISKCVRPGTPIKLTYMSEVVYVSVIGISSNLRDDTTRILVLGDISQILEGGCFYPVI